MKYGEVDLKVLMNSLTITKRKSQEVRHYPGTDISTAVELGKQATIITCTLKAVGDEERILIEQLLHGEQEATLGFHNFYYKKVVTGETAEPEPQTADKEVWFIPAEFIALDPIPYSSAGEALY